MLRDDGFAEGLLSHPNIPTEHSTFFISRLARLRELYKMDLAAGKIMLACLLWVFSPNHCFALLQA